MATKQKTQQSKAVVPAQEARMPAVLDPHIASLPAEIRDQLAKEAQGLKDRIQAGTGDKIRLTKKKTFKLPSGEESAGPLRVVVLDFAALKQYFDKPYTEGDKTAVPACFALGAVKLDDLVPSKSSPVLQNEKCGKPGQDGCCPLNEFGSKGNGKACADSYLLAVVGVDKADSEMYTLQVPAKSTKYWSAAVAAVQAKYGFSPIVVSTEIWFDPDAEYQMLRFGNFEPNPFLKEHLARKAEATARILREPDVSGYTPPKQVGKRK